MFCTHCGAALSNNARFCHACGQPQQTVLHHQGTTWELCQIEFEEVRPGMLIRGPRGCFFAMASGPNGRYCAGQSREIRVKYLRFGQAAPSETDETILAVIDELEASLCRDRWVPLGQGGPLFWQRRYRRLAR
jgi:hypothetical protein